MKKWGENRKEQKEPIYICEDCRTIMFLVDIDKEYYDWFYCDCKKQVIIEFIVLDYPSQVLDRYKKRGWK